MIMMMPTTVTKISCTPSLGSIGEDWVRMCSIADGPQGGIVLDQRRPEIGIMPPRASENSTRPTLCAASTVEPPNRDRRSAMPIPPISAISSQLRTTKLAIDGQWPHRQAGQRHRDDDRDPVPVGRPHQIIPRVLMPPFRSVPALPTPRLRPCRAAPRSPATGSPAGCRRRARAGPLCPGAGPVGEAVDVQQHRQPLRAVAPGPQQDVGVRGGHPAHHGDHELPGRSIPADSTA